jgi:IPT/TIG domain/FG-GAP-like repeat/FG-GAP repeat
VCQRSGARRAIVICMLQRLVTIIVMAWSLSLIAFAATGPSISSLSPTSGTPGTTIAITGTGFGATQGASTVKFQTAVATPISWSNSSITVAVPIGATTGLVAIRVGGTTAWAWFSVTAGPVISSLSPASAAVGSSITITGVNFGSTQGSSIVTFNGVTVTPASWNVGSILVPVPAGTTSGPVVVQVNGVSSNGAQFTVAQNLQITTLSPVSGAVGTVITIAGNGFGATQGASTVKFQTAVATPISWSDSSITVAVPIGAATGMVTVTVGSASTSASFSIVPSPTISSLSPASATVGSLVTITGSNFGSIQGSSTVTFNGVTASPTSWNSGSIMVPVPSGATSGLVLVKVNGVSSNASQFTVAQNLQISSLSPASGAVGTVITIAGNGFGSTQGSSTVKFNSTVAAPISWSDSSIAVAVPIGAATGVVTVIVGGTSTSASFSIVPSPTISSLSPASAAVGSPITITGSNFGSNQGSSTVTFNGVAASPTSWNSGSIVVPVPGGAASGPVVVNVNGVPSNGAQFSVPRNLQITGLSQTAGAIGAVITISGSSFGAAQGASIVKFGGTVATPVTWSDSSISAPVPMGATTGLIAVTVGGSSAWAWFSIVPGPIISNLSPALAAIGSPVTITGANFGSTQGSSMVSFNGVTGVPTSWTSSSIVVPVPAGATTGLVTITVAGAPSAGALLVAVSAGGPYAYSAAAGDFDNNRNTDLAIVNRCLSSSDCTTGSVDVFLGNGNGNGTFKPAVTYPTGGIESVAASVGDFNGDGAQDLAVVNNCATGVCASGEVSVLLGHGNGTFQPPLSFPSGGYQSIGIATGDFNGDRILDVAIANNCADSSCASGGTVTVLMGKGDGTFKPAASYGSGGQGAFSVVVGDFNRDGLLDLAVANDCASSGCSSGGSVGILLGNRDGTFKPAVAYASGGQGAYSLVVADFNNDGIADLAVVNNCANNTCASGGAVGVLLGNGDGTFQPAIVSPSGGIYSYSLAVGDFNLDGYADLAVTNEYGNGGGSNGGSVSVLLGNGDGTFQSPLSNDSRGTNPFSVVAANFNTYGSIDLAVANSCLPALNCAEGVVTVLAGNGDGTFGQLAGYTASTATGQSSGVAPPHHQVSLSWDASASVNGYNVYRSTQLGGPFTKINPVLDVNTNFADLSVAAGQTYYYVTTAVRSGLESGYSNEVQASVPSP